MVAAGAAGAGTAILWPDDTPHPATPRPSVLVSPTGSDRAPCTRTQPCRSFDRAYRAARPGEAIEIAGGTYPTQRIRVDPRKLGEQPPVRLSPAPGELVTIAGDLIMYGSNAVFDGGDGRSRLRLRNLFSQAVAGARTSHDVTFENLDGAAFLIGPNRRITIRGGDWGPNVLCGGGGTHESKVGPDGTIRRQVPRDIVLEGLRIHDQTSRDLARCHTGGLMLISADGFTLRDTVFERNAVYDVSVGDFTGRYGNPRRVVFERNRFGHPVGDIQDRERNNGQTEVQFSEPGEWRDWTIRGNRFDNGLSLIWSEPDKSFARVRVTDNVGGSSDCDLVGQAVTWSDNVWDDEVCGSSDRLAADRTPR
jgi:hypothetical protein